MGKSPINDPFSIAMNYFTRGVLSSTNGPFSIAQGIYTIRLAGEPAMMENHQEAGVAQERLLNLDCIRQHMPIVCITIQENRKINR